MKKIDKRIILYLDNQMSQEERKIFESELTNSSELSKEVESYKNILKSLTFDETQSKDDDYFANLIANFRQTKLSSKKSFSFKPAYSLTAAVSIIILVFIFFNPFNKTEIETVDKIIAGLDETEAAELIDYYSNGLTQTEVDQTNGQADSLFADMISNEFEFDESDVKMLVSSDENYLNSIFSNIDSDETEKIYNEILNTKFF